MSILTGDYIKIKSEIVAGLASYDECYAEGFKARQYNLLLAHATDVSESAVSYIFCFLNYSLS